MFSRRAKRHGCFCVRFRRWRHQRGALKICPHALQKPSQSLCACGLTSWGFMAQQKARWEEGRFFPANLLLCMADSLESAFQHAPCDALRTLSQESGEKAKCFALHDRLNGCSFTGSLRGNSEEHREQRPDVGIGIHARQRACRGVGERAPVIGAEHLLC